MMKKALMTSISRVARVLRRKEWLGIGVILAVLSLVSSVITGDYPKEENYPEEPPDQQGASNESTSNERTLRDFVRCPGGGDWLGRERNRKSSKSTFDAPEGKVIVDIEQRTLKSNDGFAKHSFTQSRATMVVTCDPPNYPGAGGGWMEAEFTITLKDR